MRKILGDGVTASEAQRPKRTESEERRDLLHAVFCSSWLYRITSRQIYTSAFMPGRLSYTRTSIAGASTFAPYPMPAKGIRTFVLRHISRYPGQSRFLRGLGHFLQHHPPIYNINKSSVIVYKSDKVSWGKCIYIALFL